MSFPVNPPLPDNRVRLQTLLDSWLHLEASPQAVLMTLAIQQQLLDMLNQMIAPEQETNLVVEDIEQTLKGGEGLCFSQATALGSDRALVTSRQLWQTATWVGHESMN